MLDRWILPISERRSWIILRIAWSSRPASPVPSASQVTVRSPEATRSATCAASRIGRVIVRASQSATAVTTKIVTASSTAIACRCWLISANASSTSCLTTIPQRNEGRYDQAATTCWPR